MKIGIIGSGFIGGALATKLTKLGHTVAIANSRGPASLADVAAKSGANAATVEDAVTEADLIVVTIPLSAIPKLPKGLFAKVPAAVPVVDTGNYYPLRDTVIASIENGTQTGTGWAEEHLARPLVKAFNNIIWYSLAERGVPKGTHGRIALPVAGDDPKTKDVVLALVEQLGFDAVDAGSIAESWRFEPGTPAYCTELEAEPLKAVLARTDRARNLKLAAEMFDTMIKLPPTTTPPELVRMAQALMARAYP